MKYPVIDYNKFGIALVSLLCGVSSATVVLAWNLLDAVQGGDGANYSPSVSEFNDRAGVFAALVWWKARLDLADTYLDNFSEEWIRARDLLADSEKRLIAKGYLDLVTGKPVVRRVLSKDDVQFYYHHTRPSKGAELLALLADLRCVDAKSAAELYAGVMETIEKKETYPLLSLPLQLVPNGVCIVPIDVEKDDSIIWRRMSIYEYVQFCAEKFFGRKPRNSKELREFAAVQTNDRQSEALPPPKTSNTRK